MNGVSLGEVKMNGASFGKRRPNEAYLLGMQSGFKGVDMNKNTTWYTSRNDKYLHNKEFNLISEA